jgi:transposase
MVRYICGRIWVLVAAMRSEPRHAAVNNRRCVVGDLGSGAGGEAGERHDTACGVDRGGVVAPNPDAVFAPLFTGGSGFFLAADKVQVKYEMLRARLVEGVPVADAAAAHGYSRAAFYLVAAAFDQSGMAGLLDERRGRRGPVKLRPEIVDFIRADAGSGAQIAEQVADRFGVRLHRRTVERVRRR